MEPPVHYFQQVESTQDVAHRLAAEGAVAGTAVVAAEQSAGRGSRGRAWVSGLGGLWLSVVWRPEAATGAETLSLRAALLLAEALEAAGSPPLGIKWPNDLMQGERKVGGILCEARWAGDRLGWIVVGAGINVRNPIPPALAGRAGALQPASGSLEPAGLIRPAVAALRRAGIRTGPLDTHELAAFAGRDWLAGRALTSPVPGQADGIAPDGALRVRTAGGSVELLRSGTVQSGVPTFQP
ncbi:MAG TPA: biotin--[acetyl-CoA-carboxylase] ligase [Gemmatimonadales bacterium]|nr:biotin--[acetyl-CoA-carboxylase] ligase [Gemmatimonadales bacterium]